MIQEIPQETDGVLKIGLRVSAACDILSRVPTNWEIEDPRRNEKTGHETKNFPLPVNGLLRPAVSSIRLREVVFASGDRRP